MRKFTIFFLCWCFVVIQPVFSLSKTTKLILDEIQKLAGVIKALEQRIDSIDRKIQIVDERVSAFSRNQADTNQKGENFGLSLQFIKEELNELKDNVTKINDRILMLTQRNLAGAGEGETGATQDSLVQSPENIYYTAYSDYLKKSYDLAIKGFQQFIRLFPGNGLSDNSLYWIGECYYAQRMYQEAANTFDRLINEYPEGDKIPAGMLKKGFALIEMGRQSEGTDALKELISKFPLSEEASLAQQKIREILD